MKRWDKSSLTLWTMGPSHASGLAPSMGDDGLWPSHASGLVPSMGDDGHGLIVMVPVTYAGGVGEISPDDR